MAKVPRPRARSNGRVDLSQFVDPPQSVARGIQEMQTRIDQLERAGETPVLPPLPEQGEKDTVSPKIRNQRLALDAVKSELGYTIEEAKRKVVQYQIATLPTDAGQGDYFTGFIKGISGDGEDSGATVKIAKPPLLRRTPYDGETYNGVAYVYSDNYTRTADGTTQTIDPPYVVGDVIYAALRPMGGTDVLDENSKPVHWVDINADGRHWAGTGVGGFIIGKITAHTAGQVYVISLYADGFGSAATATGVACTVINVSASETLANNTWLAVTQVSGGTYEAIAYGVLS